MSETSEVTCTSLVRAGDPVRAAGQFAARLTALAANADPGGAVGWQLDLSRPGAARLSLWGHGVGAGDLRWCVDGLATTSARRPATPAVTGWWLHELALPAAGAPERGGPVGFTGEPGLVGRRRVPDPGAGWPVDGELVTGELVAAGRGGAVLRFAFAPCPSSAADELAERVLAQWPVGQAAEARAYLGTPVRCRVLLATREPDVPLRLRAVLRAGVPGVRIAAVGRLGEPGADAVWDAPQAGAQPMPARAARILCLAPGVGQRVVVGVPVSDPVPPDTPARHAEPTGPRLRLGTAVRANGARSAVHLGVAAALQHVDVVGASGSGKSTLLTDLLLEAYRLGVGVTCLDLHGATVTRFLSCAPPDAVGRVDVARLGDLANPVRVSMWDADTPEGAETTVAGVVDLFEQLFDPHHQGYFGERAKRWFTLWAEATIALFGRRASLQTIADLAVDAAAARRTADAIRDTHPSLAASLLGEYGRLGGDTAADMVSWVRSKLTRFTSTAHLRSILGTGEDSLELRRRVEEPSMLLVDLAMPRLGAPGARTVGTLIAQQLWTAIQERSRRDLPHLFVVDEAHLLQHGPLPAMLSEGRKFGLAVVVVHQHRSQLVAEVLDALEGNAGSFVAFRSSPTDAVQHTARLGAGTVDDLPHLRTLDALASLLVDGTPTAPFTLRVDRPRPAAVDAGEAIEAASRDVLVEPYRQARALDLDEIDRRLAAGARQGEAGRLVDGWLVRRAGAAG